MVYGVKREVEWTKFERAVWGTHAVKEVRDFVDQIDQEVWMNSLYVVAVRRQESTIPTPFGRLITLTIRRRDREADHDWRDFQRIKNEILGPEVECIQLYPAESRLVDTANQYYLFALEGLPQWPFGFGERLVSETADPTIGGKQRPWFEGERPKDVVHITEELVAKLSYTELIPSGKEGEDVEAQVRGPRS